MKRILSLVLMLALVLSMGIFTSASAADDGFVDGKFTETRHITVEIYNRNNDGGTDPTNNVWTAYIQKNMLEKYNVEVEFVSVGRWTEVDDIAQLLADGSAPDICYTYGANTILTYANMKDADGNPGVIDLAICGRCWKITISIMIRIRKPRLCGPWKPCWRTAPV